MIYILSACVIIVFSIWFIPKIQVRSISLQDDPVRKHELENELRKTIVQIAGGFSLIISLIFTWNQLNQTKNKDSSEQINKSISLMESKQEYVKIGAIYSMEQLATNNEDTIYLVTNILSSFLRGSYQWKVSNILPEHKNEVTQATLEVIAKLLVSRPDIKIDLSNTDLRKVELQNEHFSNCTFIDTHFEESDLLKTKFDNSTMNGSVFDESNLSGVSFTGVDLSNASFRGAIFSETNFSGSILSHVSGLKQSDIDMKKIIIDKNTILPKGLKNE